MNYFEHNMISMFYLKDLVKNFLFSWTFYLLS